MLHKTGLPWMAWLALLPQLAALVSEIVTALQDGKLEGPEVSRIGQDLVSLVAHAMA